MEPWRKTLYISWVILFFHAAGMGMLVPFIPLYIKELGVFDPKAQSEWSGILYGVTYLVSALLAPLWGALSDKYGRKPLILRASLGISIITLLMAFITNVYQLLALRILHGACGAMFPAFIALVSYNLPKDKIGQGVGTMQTAILAGNILGPFIGGILSDLMGYRNVLLVISLLTLVAGTTTFLLVHEPKRDPAKKRATVMSNIKLVLLSRQLRLVAMIMFAVQFAIFIVQPILPLFIVSIYGKGNSATMVGLVFSVTGFTTLLFAPYWGKEGDRKGHGKVLLQSLFFTGILYFPQALVASVYQLLPMRAVMGFFVAGIVPSTQSVIVKNTDDSQRGGVLGIAHSVNIMGQAIGPIVGGSLGAVFGYRVPFVLTAILLVSLSYFFRNFFKKE
jgi:MFS transporter, DHA1 family, multidrug resistance protein